MAVVAAAVSAAVVLVGCTTPGDSGVPLASAGPPTPDSSAPGASAGDRARWVVTLGDSYISGEGARWAGNTASGPKPVDALGADAYFDRGRHESVPGCHRAEQSVATLGGRLRGKDLACSGATTRSSMDGGDFKPGLDFFDDGSGHRGQALALQRFATSHAVRAVVVSVGGNDFGFAPVVAQCVADFVATVGSDATYCRDDPTIAASLDHRHVARLTAHIAHAIHRVGVAMRRAGYRSGSYSVVVQTYPSPLPPGRRIRYPPTQLARSLVGGCPFYGVDATWATRTLLATINTAVTRAVVESGVVDVAEVDMGAAFAGHRLCEIRVAQLSETALRSWRSRRTVDRLEWVNMLYAKPGPWQLQESLHPDFWGMLAERSCIRQAVRTLPATSGTCRNVRAGLRRGEPVMRLVP